MKGRVGDTSKILYVEFNDLRRAYSVVVNAHELLHGVQEGRSKINDVLFGLCEIPGYSTFFDRLRQDPVRNRELMEEVMKTHQLNYLNRESVRGIAQRAGLPMRQYRRLLEEHVPVMNFLSCSTEGEAYLDQTEAVRAAPWMDESVRPLYVALSIVDALSSPFQKPRERIYEIGLGMVEWMRAHPEEQIRRISLL